MNNKPASKNENKNLKLHDKRHLCKTKFLSEQNIIVKY